MENKDTLLLEIQKIIDLMASNQKEQANQKLVEVSHVLDDIMDATENDEELVEFHKYQILLNHLNVKING
ncbi:hypothetical protein [Flavobacterium sp.]|jgi:hypothetical protein|uniref:hypothetical protein n=1 Tax=Flavobacterium sp. TaxID=239 RepID=UPI0037C0FCCC